MIFISVKDKLFNLTNRQNNFKDTNHFLFSFDLVEYNFKDIYKSFTISYFSKDADLLSDNFVDENDLKWYESIEKIDNDKLQIIIKKFKFRITFAKRNNMSDDIIISDDFEFDLNRLNHMNSMLKIAIIKDNCQKWLKSGNLDNYDYIFASDEYYDTVKEKYNVFRLNSELGYRRIIDVLNILYKRKFDKFYHFINYVGFMNVFPKWNGYFKVVNSEYFDDEWYRKNYNLTDNTDSAIHYILIGFAKGNDPGPNFSTNEYYEVNNDVKKAGMNPLIHYESFGRREKRLISSEKFYTLISNSPYFDKQWYEENYDISNEYDDAVTHYLKIGYKKGYNPGPDFDTNEYLEANPDVKQRGMNPLVHYEKLGKNEGRPLSVDEYHLSIISNSPYFDREWYEKTYDLSDVPESGATHYLKIGFKKGFNPGPDFDTNMYYELNSDIKRKGINPLLHYEMYGRKENRKIKLESEHDE